jgi:hypothetical protein
VESWITGGDMPAMLDGMITRGAAVPDLAGAALGIDDSNKHLYLPKCRIMLPYSVLGG